MCKCQRDGHPGNDSLAPGGADKRGLRWERAYKTGC